MVNKLDRLLVKGALRGFKLVNKITEAEKRTWLKRLTVEEARKIFDDLHQNADDWKNKGGHLEALERQRIESKVKGRQVYIRIAKQRGLL